MPRQACLDLRGDRLRALWRRLPKRARRAVIERYARLIAQAAQAPRPRRGGAREGGGPAAGTSSTGIPRRPLTPSGPANRSGSPLGRLSACPGR
jgi:hypothetical protein